MRLEGELRLRDATSLWQSLGRAAERARERLDIDLGGVEAVDGAVAALLVAFRDRLERTGVHAQLVNAPAQVRPLLELYEGGAAVPRPRREDAITRLGRLTAGGVARAGDAVAFVGEMVHALGRFTRSKRAASWRDLPALVERAAADGVPIVLLLDFLVGFVMAFQSARQLQESGANVFVADVVGISVTRELSPLVTAIIVSGRSGAAFAAEIGTMRVSEEIDALRTIGIAPVPYLTLPRVVALAIAAPILTLLGDIVGILGGVVVGTSSLGLSARGYLAELRTAIVPSDVWTGLVKSVAFGVAIALIGCRSGFATRGAAAGVGRSTTQTVVTCLFTLVVLDTMFTLLFRTFAP